MELENNFLKVIIIGNMIYYITEIDNKNPKIMKGLIHKGIQFVKFDTSNINDIEEIKQPIIIKELVNHHNETVTNLLYNTKDSKLREYAFNAVLCYNMEER